ELGEKFCAEHFPGHQALVCTHPDGHNHSGNIHVHILPYRVQRQAIPQPCRHNLQMGAGGRSQESPEKGHTRLLMQGGREFMKNEINAVLENMTAATPEPEDYTGEDGLLYCGKCRKPKEAYFAPDKAAIFGRDRHPAECDCQRAAREEREAAEKRRRHLDTVEELKRRGFTDPTMRDWTFENDNGRNPQTGIARRYVEHWEDMRTDNIGCLFWGGVGTGKS